MTENPVAAGQALIRSVRSLLRGRLILPLALAQFICSFAGSNMNVMINDISEDLDTTVKGVQTAITLFLLIMAVLMIPCSKLTDRWGRKRCFTVGLTLYGIGALISAVSPNLGVLILGNSVLEGVGTALLIPPVYILATLWFTDLTSRAWAFGVISGLGGIGAAAGPLIGGLITTAISWRAAFIFQAAVVAMIVLLSRRLEDPLAPTRPARSTRSARSCRRSACSASSSGSFRPAATTLLLAIFLVVGAAFLLGVLPLHPLAGAGGEGAAALHRAVQEPDVQPRPRHAEHPVAAAPGDVVRRLRLPAGGSRLQRDQDRRCLHRGDARHPRLVPRRRAARQAVPAEDADRRRLHRHPRPGSRSCSASSVPPTASAAFVPGLLLIGLGVGAMLTPSVNVVQSSFPEELQGEISGLSRSVSNLGSSFGTAIAGTILVSVVATGTRLRLSRWSSLGVFGLIGLAAALLLPAKPEPQAS